MANFFLVQPALETVGGHYYDFSARLVPVMEAAGYQPVLAVHRDCQGLDQFPSHWRVVPVFVRAESRMRPPRREFANQDLRGLLWPRLARLHDWVAARLRTARWQRHTEEFYRACCQLFEKVPLAPGDQVLIASAGDLDLAGLASYLRSDPRTRLAEWSFLFHYFLFAGREPDYAAQATRLDMLRRHFRAVLAGLERHSLKFYATTPRLAAQFELLDVAPFGVLPYPVNPVFQAEAAAGRGGNPLRVVCAGGARREKGGHVVADLIADLWEDFLLPGKIQLLVQSDRSQKTRKLLGLASSDIVDACHTYAAVRSSVAPVVLVPHPLNPAEYVDLVQQADIGLFLYDSRAYYVRCSGILLEMLGAGVPAIVPAGCWLADQLFEPLQRHLRHVQRHEGIFETARLAGLRWKSDGGGRATQGGRRAEITCGGKAGACVADIEVPAEATELWLRLRPASSVTGSWLRVDLEQPVSPGRPQASVVRAETGLEPLYACFRLGGKSSAPRLKFYNAYHDTPITLRDLEVRCLAAPEALHRTRPVGAVGLIAAEPGHIPDLLDEMLVRYEHYRATAGEFARTVSEQHRPENAVRMLLSGVPLAVDRFSERNVA